MADSLLEQLNESQREAVLYCDGPSLVIAGAGSGKTRVLTYKTAYLLQEKQLNPWNILALTFTNKAAAEMKERIGRLVGTERARYLQMGTFHAIFSRILRTEAEKIGYQSNFTIYDQTDSRSLVKAIMREMKVDDKIYKPGWVAEQISKAKNQLVGSDRFGTSSLFDAHKPAVAAVYSEYTKRCRQANAMDFDDLLLNTHRLFETHEDIRRKYVERFCYVLVDEYQDTNMAQQAIVWQLTRERQMLCVVGDDAQSIYAFRGANIENILRFQEIYKSARLFKLEQNYRSTQLIVQAANSLIKKNGQQIPKDIYSRNESGEQLMLKKAYSDKEEAVIVCKELERIRRKEGAAFSDFAVLYRTNSQSRSFEEAMRKRNIPYRIFGGMSFYQRKEIKDIIAYFRLVVNHDDEEALKRIINYPARGIGDTTVGKIVAAASAAGQSLWEIVGHPKTYGLNVSAATVNKLKAFQMLVEGWGGRAVADDAYTLGRDIISESGIGNDIYGSRNPDDIARQENLEEFLGAMQDFVESRKEEGMADQVRLTDFLQEVSLLTDIETDGKDDGPKVSLMTIHSAKGLEFPTVFIVGLEENIFPSPMSVGTLRELEEERRLLYVAITRAEKHCIMTCAQSRFRYGKMEFDSPSRFIKDIDPQFISVDDGAAEADSGLFGSDRLPWRSQSQRGYGQDSFKRELAGAAARRFKPVGDVMRRYQPAGSGATAPQPVASGAQGQQSSPAGLKEGCVIEHQRFGIGTVVRLEGKGENEKATVDFRNTGMKQLLLKFAKFKIVK